MLEAWVRAGGDTQALDDFGRDVAQLSTWPWATTPGKDAGAIPEPANCHAPCATEAGTGAMKQHPASTEADLHEECGAEQPRGECADAPTAEATARTEDARGLAGWRGMPESVRSEFGPAVAFSRPAAARVPRRLVSSRVDGAESASGSDGVGLSRREFVRDFESLGRPVLLLNLTAEWGALTGQEGGVV